MLSFVTNAAVFILFVSVPVLVGTPFSEGFGSVKDGVGDVGRGGLHERDRFFRLSARFDISFRSIIFSSFGSVFRNTIFFCLLELSSAFSSGFDSMLDFLDVFNLDALLTLLERGGFSSLPSRVDSEIPLSVVLNTGMVFFFSSVAVALLSVLTAPSIAFFASDASFSDDSLAVAEFIVLLSLSARGVDLPWAIASLLVAAERDELPTLIARSADPSTRNEFDAGARVFSALREGPFPAVSPAVLESNVIESLSDRGVSMLLLDIEVNEFSTGVDIAFTVSSVEEAVSNLFPRLSALGVDLPLKNALDVGVGTEFPTTRFILSV